MLLLRIVGCSKDSIQDFAAFLQAELRDIVKKNNIHLCNGKNIGKAEVCKDLLRVNTRLTLPANKDTARDYWGYVNVEDWDALYERLFSPAIASGFRRESAGYFSSIRLKLVIQYFAEHSVAEKSKKSATDFGIYYRTERLRNGDRLCVLELEIDDALVDADALFDRIVSKLDPLFPDAFVSAVLSDSREEIFGLIYDSELLTKKIHNVGNSMYISNKMLIENGITGEPHFDHFCLSSRKNGVVLQRKKDCGSLNYMVSSINDLLVPLSRSIGWSNLVEQEYWNIYTFDTLSVYYDSYDPTDPEIFFSRGYTPAQLASLAELYGDKECQLRYPLERLLLTK
jgi:hypothetical protein